ncbi:MAG: hypothetical protein PHE55_09130 [Methylococcaceae bacterium]|nr:hypothetical protein [Methylococcaceae bacterium]
MTRRWLLLSLAALAIGNAWGTPKLLYRSLEAEAATEYQTGDGQFGPGFVRLIARAELALTDRLTGKLVASPCAGPYRMQPEGVTQCTTERLLEELTLGGAYSGFDFSLGRQVITQGNTEGFILLDRYNGRDFCRFARVDVQNKLPNWIARGRASLNGDASLSLTFAPYSGQSRLPRQGSYCDDEFHDAGRFANLHDPENDSLSAWAGGAELAVSRDRWSATLNVMSTQEDSFVLKTLPRLEKTRPRTLWLGGTASTTLGGIVLRGEFAFSPEREFTLLPQALGGLLRQGIGTDGVDKRWNLLASVGLEARHDDWYWALQYFLDHAEGGPALVRDADSSHMMSLRTRKTFANETIAFDSFAIVDMDYSDLALRASLSYDIDEDTAVTLGGTAYASMGRNAGLFGHYVGRESLFLKLRRTLF